MSDKVIDPDLGKRDILESKIPRDVLDILLKDRTTGKNILWMTVSRLRLKLTLCFCVVLPDNGTMFSSLCCAPHPTFCRLWNISGMAGLQCVATSSLLFAEVRHHGLSAN